MSGNWIPLVIGLVMNLEAANQWKQNGSAEACGGSESSLRVCGSGTLVSRPGNHL
jgi:hypothetical protein